MAEIGMIASLIGISGAGIKLMGALHEFGSNVLGAQEQTEEIEMRISLYCMALKGLAERLKQEEAVHSAQGLQMIEDLKNKSELIFGKIDSILPNRGRPDKMTLLARFKWNWKKARVEWLIGTLESFKSTLTVLIQLLYAGKVIQTARETGDHSIAKQNEIGLEKDHLRSLVLYRHRCVSRLPILQAAAEKEEKSAIDASPSDPPEGFVRMAQDSQELVKFSDPTLKVVDVGFEAADNQDSRALVLHRQGQWLNYLFDQLTTISSSPSDAYEEKRASLKTAYQEQSMHPERPAAPHSLSDSVIPSTAYGGHSFSTKSFHGQEPEEPGMFPRKPHLRIATVESDEEDIDDKDSIKKGKPPPYSPRRPRRRHTTTDLDSGASVHGTTALRYDPDRKKGASHYQASSVDPQSSEKLGITWRRGNSRAWREFKDQRLVDFSCPGVSFKVKQEDFEELDEWTEVREDQQKISKQALSYLNYSYYRFERFERSYQPTDADGNAIGEVVKIYKSVFRVRMPLLFSEIEQLVKLTLQIEQDEKRGLEWWLEGSTYKPPTRYDDEIENDLPYPNAPLGNAGFKAEKYIIKASRWLQAGNKLASHMKGPEEIFDNWDGYWKAFRTGGKDLSGIDFDKDNHQNRPKLQSLEEYSDEEPRKR